MVVLGESYCFPDIGRGRGDGSIGRRGKAGGIGEIVGEADECGRVFDFWVGALGQVMVAGDRVGQERGEFLFNSQARPHFGMVYAYDFAFGFKPGDLFVAHGGHDQGDFRGQELFKDDFADIVQEAEHKGFVGADAVLTVGGFGKDAHGESAGDAMAGEVFEVALYGIENDGGEHEILDDLEAEHGHCVADGVDFLAQA